MRSQYPLKNLKTGETVGRLSIFDADSAAGSVTLGPVSGLLRAAVKRGPIVSIVPTENVPAGETDLPEHVVVADDDIGDDLAYMFDGEQDTAYGRIARSVVAEHVGRPDTADVSIGATDATFGLVWHDASKPGGAPVYRASVAETVYAANGTAWTVYVTATYRPDVVSAAVDGHTDKVSGEWVPAVPAVYSETAGTLRFRPRVVNA